MLGAALAYRIFIWLLPFALALILTLTLVAGRDTSSIAHLVDNAGLTGFIAKSVAEAADGTHGWAVVSALVSTLFVLAYQSSALLRSIRAVTALAWSLPVGRVPKPTRSTLLFLVWLLAFMTVGASAAPIRHALGFPLDLLVNLIAYSAGFPLLWLLLSWFLLPHGAARWGGRLARSRWESVLGAISLFNSLILFPWLTEREEQSDR